LSGDCSGDERAKRDGHRATTTQYSLPLFCVFSASLFCVPVVLDFRDEDKAGFISLSPLFSPLLSPLPSFFCSVFFSPPFSVFSSSPSGLASAFFRKYFVNVNFLSDEHSQ